MKPAYTSLLVCPVCHGKLFLVATKAKPTAKSDSQKQELWCKYDGLAYPLINDIPVMLTQHARLLSNEEKLRKLRSTTPAV